MVILLNAFLFLCCVILFIVSCISLLVGAFPIALILMFLFSFCYWAMRYDGPQAKHHVIHFANDGDGDEGEPTPEYYKPFNRENFKFN